MAIVPRFIKPVSGTRNYIPDTTILSAQVNRDFNDLYDDYNGDITDANIAAGANIDGSKLANGTVTGAKIANNTITDANVSPTAFIQRVKLQQPAFNVAAITPNLNIAANTETPIWSVSFTHTDGPILFMPNGFITVTASTGIQVVTFRWKRAGVTVPSGTSTVNVDGISAGTAITIPAAVDTTFPAASGTSTLTLTATVSFGTFATNAAPGSIFVVEVR